jgi:hypothetical protein
MVATAASAAMEEVQAVEEVVGAVDLEVQAGFKFDSAFGVLGQDSAQDGIGLAKGVRGKAKHEMRNRG